MLVDHKSWIINGQPNPELSGGTAGAGESSIEKGDG